MKAKSPIAKRLAWVAKKVGYKNGKGQPIDRKQVRRFLKLLDRNASSFEFRTFDDNKKMKRSALSWKPKFARDTSFDALEQMNWMGAGVFLVINSGRNDEGDITRIRALFVDQDAAGPRLTLTGLPKPHIIVESSPCRYHYYWLVDGLDTKKFNGLQQRLATALGTDTTIKDLSRVMRVPGFIHQKGEPFMTRIVASSERAPYPARWMTKAIRALRPKQDQVTTAAPNIAAEGAVSSGRHADLLSLTQEIASTCHKQGIDAETGMEMVNAAIANRYAGRNLGGEEAKRAFEGAFRKLANGSLTASGTGDTRNPIEHKAGNSHATAEAIEATLISAGVEIYRRGAGLVRPSFNNIPNADKQTVVPELLKVEAPWLSTEISRHARCEVLRVSPDGSPTRKTVDWPGDVIKAVLVSADKSRFPVLRGMIEVPLLRKDGSVCVKPGYDADTGLYVAIKPGWPSISCKPKQAEAKQSLAVLEKLIRTFDFKSGADQSVVLSAMLTGVVRHLLRTAPMHAISAPVAGSGKSMLMDTCAVISTGRVARVLTWGRNEEESMKRVAAVLMQGDPLVCFDNVEHPLCGDTLCAALTQEVQQHRRLGASELEVVAQVATFMATGNNLVLKGDMSRRALVATVDPMCERPELRSFKTNPIDVAKRKRRELVNAAITIVGGYMQSKSFREGKRLPSFGSFDDWSRIVRGALLWVGAEDPVKVTKRTRKLDPERLAIVNLMSAWNGVFGSKPVTAADVIRKSDELAGSGEHGLADALDNSAQGAGGKHSAKTLGRFLSTHKERIVDGMMFNRAGTNRDGSYKWVLSKPG